MKKRVLIIAIVLTTLFASAGVAYALDNLPFKIDFSRLPEKEQGPDEIFVLDEYGLVCVFKDGSLDCECPCEQCATVTEETVAVAETQAPEETQPPSETQPPVETEEPTPTPPTPTSTVPTPVPTSPAPTSTPEPNGILIRHFDTWGNEVWTKCMPLSAWNGHKNHPGHLVQDQNLGSCYQ